MTTDTLPLQGLSALVTTVAALRHPQTGCPWDLAQTHASLRPYLLEEAYEAVTALQAFHQHPHDAQARHNAIDELGDVLLQVVLHAQLAQDAGQFCLDDVARHLNEKLIRRHPHVFGEGATLHDAEAVTTQWQAIKASEKGEQSTSVLEGLAEGQPALSRAYAYSRKAVKQGFAWPTPEAHWACVLSEFDELNAELAQLDAAGQPTDEAHRQRLEEELGDCLFATVTLAGQLGLAPEVALHHANDKFKARFQAMEALANQPLKTLSFDEWDTLWRQAKQQLAQG